jgi:hypothetical protein
MARHAASIVDGGGPLGATLKASDQGITTTRNDLTGYVLVEATSHSDAARMFESHSHFSVFSSDPVKIVECLRIPGI